MVWARGGVARDGCGDLIPLVVRDRCCDLTPFVAAIIFNYPPTPVHLSQMSLYTIFITLFLSLFFTYPTVS